MSEPKLTKLTRKNFLATTRGAVGSKLFQNLFVRDQTGAERDVMQGGEFSCAYVVSGLLTLFGLIDRPHATVATTLEQMAKAGWVRAESPSAGMVIYWPEHDGHEHIGIVVSDGMCVSNSDKAQTPVLHGFRLSSGLEPSAFYRHPELRAD